MAYPQAAVSLTEFRRVNDFAGFRVFFQLRLLISKRDRAPLKHQISYLSDACIDRKEYLIQPIGLLEMVQKIKVGLEYIAYSVIMPFVKTASGGLTNINLSPEYSP